MCGIWLSLGITVSREAITAVAHRGPDGEGWTEQATPAGLLAMGHRRLAIVDTSDAGLQPMRRGPLSITYNGEVYNYVELREELAGLGHVFSSASDTEVMLAAYDQWGEACLARFNGIFAFAIHDAARGIVFAARDRFGVKPLYLWQGPEGFALASEIKQILTLDAVPARIERRRVYDFLSGGLLDHSGDTMFASIRQLRGGERLTVDLARWKPGQVVEPRRWYALPAPGSLSLSMTDAATQFAELLEDAVRLQLRADVPVGSCLSGGLDSSSIVMLANRHLRGVGAQAQQNTFSAVYDDPAVDERRFIEAVTEATGAASHYTTPAPQDLPGVLERMHWHQDEPFGSTSIYAQWEVFRLAHESGVTVMLDGQGADEQLGGYHHMFGTYHAGLFRRLRWARLLREVSSRQRRHAAPWPAILRSMAIALVPPAGLDALVRRRYGTAAPLHLEPGAWGMEGDPYRSPVASAIAETGLPPVRTLGDLCRAQVESINLPALLHYEDRNSMAHAIEARVPFLDHRLVELSIGLGDEHKIVDGETKAVLRRAMASVLPPAVRNRQDKLGFPTPEKTWLAGPLADLLRREIDDVLARFPGFFRADVLQERSKAMLAGRQTFDFWLWRVVSFGVWTRVFNVSL
jgi:asparagine synthase (glutamine-hydrolysing)